MPTFANRLDSQSFDQYPKMKSTEKNSLQYNSKNKND